MITLAQLRAKPHTSVSQIRAFITCPRQHHFRYGIKAQAAFRALALVFGTAWHATIGEHLLRSRHERQVPIEELREHLRDGIVRGIAADGPPVLFEEEEQDVGAVVATAMKMLDVFVDKVPLPDQVLGVEVPFSIELTHPVTGEILPLPLIGGIDAIVLEEGNPTVWELKSGKRKWSADQLDFDLQMTGYGMAARKLGHGGAHLKLLVTTKGKVPDVQVERLVRHQRDENELAEVAISVERLANPREEGRESGWGEWLEWISLLRVAAEGRSRAIGIEAPDGLHHAGAAAVAEAALSKLVHPRDGATVVVGGGLKASLRLVHPADLLDADGVVGVRGFELAAHCLGFVQAAVIDEVLDVSREVIALGKQQLAFGDQQVALGL